MNIHRLVQDEFKGQLSDSHRQEAFNAAALLLYEGFPSQVKGELFDERMPICARYIQHVYWLRDYLNTAMDADKRAKRAPSIIPSTEYVKLMTNAAWYCAERQGHFELEAILENSFQAMITNGMKDTELLLWAHLCNSAGRLWGQRGQFERGEKYFMECLKIRKEKLGKGDENIAGLLSNLGNLNLSMARYDKALDYQKQALDWGVVGDHNEISLRAQSIITANTARVLTDMGRTEEAWAMFKIGDEMKQYKQLEKQPP
jgi:tetratricopeptide (TPR) repeat protein